MGVLRSHRKTCSGQGGLEETPAAFRALRRITASTKVEDQFEQAWYQVHWMCVLFDRPYEARFPGDRPRTRAEVIDRCMVLSGKSS